MRKANGNTDLDISTKSGARQFLGDHRALYRTWVMTAAGVLPGDDAALMRQIEKRIVLLDKIAAHHPELGASAEMLSKLRTRTVASDFAKGLRPPTMEPHTDRRV